MTREDAYEYLWDMYKEGDFENHYDDFVDKVYNYFEQREKEILKGFNSVSEKLQAYSKDNKNEYITKLLAEIEVLRGNRQQIKLMGDRVEFKVGDWTHNQPFLDFLKIHFDVIEAESKEIVSKGEHERYKDFFEAVELQLKVCATDDCGNTQFREAIATLFYETEEGLIDDNVPSKV